MRFLFVIVFAAGCFSHYPTSSYNSGYRQGYKPEYIKRRPRPAWRPVTLPGQR